MMRSPILKVTFLFALTITCSVSHAQETPGIVRPSGTPPTSVDEALRQLGFEPGSPRAQKVLKKYIPYTQQVAAAKERGDKIPEFNPSKFDRPAWEGKAVVKHFVLPGGTPIVFDRDFYKRRKPPQEQIHKDAQEMAAAAKQSQFKLIEKADARIDAAMKLPACTKSERSEIVIDPPDPSKRTSKGRGKKLTDTLFVANPLDSDVAARLLKKVVRIDSLSGEGSRTAAMRASLFKAPCLPYRRIEFEYSAMNAYGDEALKDDF